MNATINNNIKINAEELKAQTCILKTEFVLIPSAPYYLPFLKELLF